MSYVFHVSVGGWIGIPHVTVSPWHGEPHLPLERVLFKGLLNQLQVIPTIFPMGPRSHCGHLLTSRYVIRPILNALPLTEPHNFNIQELPGQNYSNSVAMTVARELGLFSRTLV